MFRLVELIRETKGQENRIILLRLVFYLLVSGVLYWLIKTVLLHTGGKHN